MPNWNFLLAASIVPQLDKCLKFMAFREVILHRVQSILSPPRIDLNFRHLSSCDTIVKSKVWIEIKKN